MKRVNGATNPHNSFFISANAGSGKTKILIDRVTALILSGVKPEEILAITFTNAAASEIEARIIKNFVNLFALSTKQQKVLITELLAESATEQHLNNLNSIKQDILLGLSKFNIKTIHSFALDLLSDFSIEAGLRPGFTVMGDIESNKILGEIIANIYSKEELGKNFNYLASRITLEQLTEHLKLITNKRSDIMYQIFKAGSVDDFCSHLKQFFEIPENIRDSDQIKAEFLARPEIGNIIKSLQLLDDKAIGKTDQKQFELLKQVASYKEIEIRTAFNKIKHLFFTTAGTIRVNFFSKKLSDKIGDLIPNMETLSEEYQRLVEYFARLDAYQINQNLIEIAVLLLAEYQAVKHKQNVLDYDDILLKALMLLQGDNGDNVTYYLANLKHILVDEAQDTSVIQWRIIDYLYNDFLSGGLDKTIFIVGDEKQSIYGFQGARHELFKQKYDELKIAFEALGKEFIKIANVKSYRSSRGIIEIVNLFCQHDYVKSCLTQFDVDLNHIAHRANENYLVKILPFCKLQKSENVVKELALPKSVVKQSDKMQEVAQNILNEIRQFIQGNYYLDSVKRNSRYEDILILCPRRSELFFSIYSALSDAAIPVSLDGSRAVNSDIIFLDYIAFIRFSYMPCDNYNLASILKSPLFKLDDKALEQLVLAQNKGSDQAKSLYDVIEAEIFDWLTNIKTTLNLLTTKSRYLSPFNYCLNITHHFDLFNEYDNEFAGDSLERVGRILDLIADFEKCYGKSYHNLYKNLVRSDLAIKNTNTGGAVRLMSIHGSKGLEAPVVILADSNSKVTLNKETLYFTEDNVLFTVGSSSFTKKSEIVNEYNHRLEAEFQRLNYVALTRSKDVLIIAGHGSNILQNSLYQTLSEQLALRDDKELETIYEQGYQLGGLKISNATDKIVAPEFDFVPKKIIPVDEAIDQEQEYNKTLGVIIHNILDDLQLIKPENRQRFIHDNIERFADKISEEDKIIFGNNLDELINNAKYDYMFSDNSYNEIEMVHNNKLIRIDKLIIHNDNIEIIDFKTDREVPKNAAEIKTQYQEQLNIYAESVKACYPGKVIKKTLFFLRNNRSISF